MKIYGNHRSGNCYKLELLCALLDLNYEWQSVDIMRGETRTPDFLARNPNAKVPLLKLSDGRCLADIALYAYTRVAADGGFELTGYPAITAWLRRIEGLPGYQPMQS